MKPTIVFAGGGSLGHVTPSIAVAEYVKKMSPDARIVFVASHRPDERRMIEGAGFECWSLNAPKFPRAFSPAIIIFPLLFGWSLIRSLRLLAAIRPSIVFSKGGFVSVPVVIAAWINGTPIILHTSDSVPNMSDRLLMKFAKTICTGFPLEDLRKVHLHTGNPVRSIIKTGSRDAGQRITGFSGKRPVLMIIGGSQGSLALNRAVDRNFETLLDRADIIHLTGVGKKINRTHARYFAREEVNGDLPHLYTLADIVVTRAGAGVLSELAALQKVAIVTPLTGVAHDHQWKNTEYLMNAGAVFHLPEERLSELPDVIRSILSDHEMRRIMGEALETCFPSDAAEKVAHVILDALPTSR